MEQRLSMVTLGVSDLDRSRLFYESLGWHRAGAHPEVVFFQAGGLVVGLFGRDELAKDAGIAPDGTGFKGVALGHNTRTREEVDRVMAEAEAAGAHIVKAAADTFWGGYAGYFADPDGHLWEIAWNPEWPLAEDGSVSLPYRA
ncbi:MAG: VOC family protein [Geminicoccaceae bacterium]|nr:VOC family protein [Geminicoccaceae bacterium]